MRDRACAQIRAGGHPRVASNHLPWTRALVQGPTLQCTHTQCVLQCARPRARARVRWRTRVRAPLCVRVPLYVLEHTDTSPCPFNVRMGGEVGGTAVTPTLAMNTLCRWPSHWQESNFVLLQLKELDVRV